MPKVTQQVSNSSPLHHPRGLRQSPTHTHGRALPPCPGRPGVQGAPRTRCPRESAPQSGSLRRLASRAQEDISQGSDCTCPSQAGSSLPRNNTPSPPVRGSQPASCRHSWARPSVHRMNTQQQQHHLRTYCAQGSDPDLRCTPGLPRTPPGHLLLHWPRGPDCAPGTRRRGRCPPRWVPPPPMSPTRWSRIPLGSISRGKHTRWNPGAPQGSLGLTWVASAMLRASVSSPAMRLCKHKRGRGCMLSELLPAPARVLGSGSPSTWMEGGHHEHHMSPRPFHGCSHTTQRGKSSGKPALLLGGADGSSVGMRRNGIVLSPSFPC